VKADEVILETAVIEDEKRMLNHNLNLDEVIEIRANLKQHILDLDVLDAKFIC